MARNVSVVLGDHFTDFVDRQLRHGRFALTSEVIRAGLRLLEEREAQLEALRGALVDGERSGDAEPFDLEAFLAAKRSRPSG